MSKCNCSGECDKCACAKPYFVITELQSGDVTIKLTQPIKIDCSEAQTSA